MSNISEEIKIYAKYLSVLVVEDDEDINYIFSSILKESFMRVDSATNGEEAYEKFLKNGYDIIITDIFMKKLDGIGLTKKIKEINRDQLVIAISAYDDSEILIKLINYGVNGFLKKPINIEDFLEAVLREVKVSMQRKERSLLKYRYLKKRLKNIKYDNVITKLENIYDSYYCKNRVNKDNRLAKKSEIIIKKPIKDKKEVEVAKPVENIEIEETKPIVKVEKEIKQIVVSEKLKKFLIQESENILKINEEFQSTMNEILLHDLNQDLIEDVSEIFSKYYAILSKIPELDSISFYFAEISDIFSDLVYGELNEDKISSLGNIDYIADDIKNLLIDIFINESFSKITFLKQILQGYYEQIKLDLGLIEDNKDDEDDIYFF